jgi:transposase-like protein/IS1 family transposase
MIQTTPLTRQCPHCGAPAERLAYHCRYSIRGGHTVRVIRCRECRKTFCDRYGTAFYDLKTPEQKVQRALQQGLEGLGPEAVARVESVHPSTVQRWVARASLQAQAAQAADRSVITGVSADNVELDELHSFAGVKHPNDEAENIHPEIGQHWTHCAMVRESRLLLEVVVGPRTEDSALKLVEGAAGRLADGSWPLWSSDGWDPYVTTLTVVFAVLIHFIRGWRRGRPREPRIVSDPRLRYGQVIKQRTGRRLVAVKRRVIFGLEEAIPHPQISTSLLERLNGTIRQHVAPLHRRTRSFAKRRTALETQVQLFKSYYNLCRAHGTLKGKAPAQAAGLIDRRWTLRELLTYNAAVISKIT